MTTQPAILDLYCKAGGAAMGYHRAGFRVVGVDHEPQKHYPFEFHLSDATDFARKHGRQFDAIHASPPCQKFSSCRHLQTIGGRKPKEYPDLIAPTRLALQATGRPYVIENVPGAPLQDYITLCGTCFGLPLYRHRLFESNVFLMAPPHHQHRWRTNGNRQVRQKYGASRSQNSLTTFICAAGHFSTREAAASAMQIDWMTRAELTQAIPPAYTLCIGRQLMTATQAHNS